MSDGIPKEIKDEIVKACTTFGSTTLGFSYGLFGFIIGIALIVLAAYKVISWLLCIALIIGMVVIILLFMLLYQYLVSTTISNSLDGIKIPDLMNLIMDFIKIPTPNIPSIPRPDKPNKPNKPPINKEMIDELSESIED